MISITKEKYDFDRERNKNLRPKPVLRKPSQLHGKLSALPISHFEFQAYHHSEQEEVTHMTLAWKERKEYVKSQIKQKWKLPYRP